LYRNQDFPYGCAFIEVKLMLRVDFLNVGHGDCTIIRHHSGRLTMVDINTSQDYDADSFSELVAEETRKRCNPLTGAFGFDSGLGTSYTILGAQMRYQEAVAEAQREAVAEAKREVQDPIAFMQTHYPGQKLWRFVLTHPDLDHMRGITHLYDSIGFDNFWDTAHIKPTPEYRSNDDKVDWEFYQRLRLGGLGSNPLFFTRGDACFAFAKDEYGNPGGDNIEILSPTADLVKTCNWAGKSNDLSLVLRLWHAGKSVLLPGDAEASAWDAMVSFYGDRLKSDFLKASHHGRDSGYHLDAVKRIAPVLTFVSVGRKPDTDASSKYRQQCPRVPSTRYHGNIRLEIFDNGEFKWFVDRNPG
jgi:competence protein ComEC